MYKIRIGNESKKRLYGWSKDAVEISKMIDEYIKNQEVDGFKSYRANMNRFDNENMLIIDYGKHSDFIYLNCDSKEEYQKYLSL